MPERASPPADANAHPGTDATRHGDPFPTLDALDVAELRPFATMRSFADGEVVFKAGQSELGVFVVNSGSIEIVNPTDGDRHITTHVAGGFSGDIDVLTGRPVIVTGIARGPTTCYCVPNKRLRELLNKAPRLSEKFLVAFQARRYLLTRQGVSGLMVVGPGKCRDTTMVREFLYRNFVPFTWYDSESTDGREKLAAWGNLKKTPVVDCGGGHLIINPTLQDLAHQAGVWRECPTTPVDFLVVGAGPAGMTAAVYAASEGLSTLVLDRLGPGGQAGGSSKIENFIGFPSGLSGTELATLGVLQMLKFGATIYTPAVVERLVPPETPGDYHTLHVDCGAQIKAKTVLVATGVSWRKLEAEGAERFERAGVHYACTSVEAMLYDNQDVAVVGAGNSAGQAVMYLADCCRDRKVHLLVRRRLGPGMSEYLSGRIRAAANVVVHEGVEVTAVRGRHRPEAVEIAARSPDAADGTPTGRKDDRPRTTIPVAAMFVFIGAEPGASWLPETVARDKLGYILTGIDAFRSGQWPLTDREPCPCETTIPGVLAAGDVRAGSTKRVGFAVGDGSLAVTCAHRLIAIR